MQATLPSIGLTKGKNEYVYSSFLLQTQRLTPLHTPTLKQWQACGNFLRRAEASVHFWIGDWLRDGEVHFHKDYAQAIALTGYSYHTLRRDKYLAERIPVERRRPYISVAIQAKVVPITKKRSQAQPTPQSEPQPPTPRPSRRRVQMIVQRGIF